MKHLMMSVAALAIAVPAYAQTTTTETPPVETTTEQAVENAGQAADTAADAATDAADAAGDAAADAEAAADDAAADAEAAADDAAADAEAAAETAEAEAEAAAEAEPAAEEVVAPTEAQPELDAANPAMLASWVEGLQVFTTNQPSGSEWDMLEGEAIPEEWDDIADIGDIVIEQSGDQYTIAGYVVDIGGFLGIGAKEVLISTDALRMATFGDDVIFATNYTREELGALPDFDDSMMMPATLVPTDAAAPADPAAAPADPAAAPADPAAMPADPAAAPADPAAMPAEAEAPAEGEAPVEGEAPAEGETAPSN